MKLANFSQEEVRHHGLLQTDNKPPERDWNHSIIHRFFIMQSYLDRIEGQKAIKASTQKFFTAFQTLVDMDRTIKTHVIQDRNDIKDYFAKCFVEELNNFEQLIKESPEGYKRFVVVREMDIDNDLDDAWDAYFYFLEERNLFTRWDEILDAQLEDNRDKLNAYEMNEVDILAYLEDELRDELLETLPFDREHKIDDLLLQASTYLKYVFYGIDELDGYIPNAFEDTFKAYGIEMITKYSICSEEVQFTEYAKSFVEELGKAIDEKGNVEEVLKDASEALLKDAAEVLKNA